MDSAGTDAQRVEWQRGAVYALGENLPTVPFKNMLLSVRPLPISMHFF